jgi:hypothetical protein
MGRTFRTMSTQTLMPRHVHNKDPMPKYAHADPMQAHRGTSVPFKLRLYLRVTLNLTLTLALTLALADDVQLHVPSGSLGA